MLAPTVAVGSSTRLRGTVKPSGQLGFKVVKRHGNVWVTDFAFHHIPMTCNEGAKTTSGNIGSYTKRVNDSGSFNLHLVHTPRNPRAYLAVRGQLTHRRTKATGTIRIHGSAVPKDPLGSGAAHNCNTTLLNWTAKVPSSR